MTSHPQVALVTGGGTGVGRATAERLAALGWRLVINFSRSRDEAEATVQHLEQLGAQAIAWPADVASDEQVRGLMARTLELHGRLDLLVNCAATTEFVPFSDLDAVSDEHWQRIFQVNVVGAFHCARAAFPALREAGRGQIVNVSSVAAQIAQGSSLPYCCSKAALDNLTVALARTFAPHVRVNGVAPGFITGRWLEQGLGTNYERIKSSFEKSLPLRRVCQPDDVAAAVLSLVTGSELVTGQVLTVDSGMLIAGFQARF